MGFLMCIMQYYYMYKITFYQGLHGQSLGLIIALHGQSLELIIVSFHVGKPTPTVQLWPTVIEHSAQTRIRIHFCESDQSSDFA